MKRHLSLLAAFAALTASLEAGSILSDDFNYPNGAIVGASGSPWVANTGNTGTAIVTNNQLYVAGSGSGATAISEDIAALLSGAPYRTNGTVPALYASFTLNCAAAPLGSGTYLAHFSGEGTAPSLSNHRGRVWTSSTNVAAGALASPGTYFLGIANSSAGNVTNGQWASPLNVGQTYTVVVRYTIATASSTLWVNPNAEADPGVTATDVVPSSQIVNIAYYAFRQANGQGTNFVDNLRVGTSFSDVAGANTAPTISSVPNQFIPRNGNTGPVPFVVGDAETPAGSLTVTATSTNTALVPVANITFNNGDGANRTVTVTPASGQQGRTLVTLTVSDGANTAQASFTVTVGAPVISPIPNQIAYSNTPIPAISFTVADPEGDALNVTTSSSNENLLKSSKVTVNGTGSSRTVTLVPEPDMLGLTTVTLSFNDGVNTATRSFYLSVSPRLGVLLADNFDYTAWNFAPQALYDAVGSPWQHVSPTSAAFYEVQTTNGWAYLSASLNEDLAAGLTNSQGQMPLWTNYPSSQAVVFYSSFALRLTDAALATGDYFVHLKNTYDGTTFRAKVFVTTNGAAFGSYRVGIANQANAGTYFPQDLTVGSDYLIVTRYNSAIGEASLWVNPTSESSAYVVGTDPLQTSPIGACGLRQSGGIGVLQISNLVVSTSFPSLPTPATITITGISVAGGTATINFDAGATDSPSGFDLLGSAVVTGTYAPTAAAITSPSAGKFQATVATSGPTQFYQVKRK